ncbi:uncharacterized protein isoform X2 [Bombus fervidus]|uniref:uncharacterized protein isoform X2 n=1 Tax=Bombus fervidus TaxID=203811 RepID=UPI003D189549
MARKKVAQTAVKPPKNVVIIRSEAEDGEIKTSEEARDAVFTLVNPRKKEIQVRTENEKLGQHPTQTEAPDDDIYHPKGHDGEGNTGLYHEAESGQTERRRLGRNEVLLQDVAQAQRGNQLGN